MNDHLGLLENHLSHVDTAHLNHQLTGRVLAEQGVQGGHLGLECVEHLLLSTLPLFRFLLSAVRFGLLCILCIDGFLDERPAGEDLVTRVYLALESRDKGVEVLVGLLEVLGVFPVQCRCVEVRGLILRIRRDDLVVELTSAVVVLLATKRYRQAELSSNVARFGTGNSGE